MHLEFKASVMGVGQALKKCLAVTSSSRVTQLRDGDCGKCRSAEPRLSGLKGNSVLPGGHGVRGRAAVSATVAKSASLLRRKRAFVGTCFRALCCKGPPPPRPEYDVVCIGLTGAGKTSLLSRLCSEGTDNIVPTTGFSIKAVPFQNAVLNVKELGGADAIKKYWSRYYQGSQGVIFVLDSASSEEDLELARTELHSALQHPQLCTLPFLILANHQDKPAARSVPEVNFHTVYTDPPFVFPVTEDPNKSVTLRKVAGPLVCTFLSVCVKAEKRFEERRCGKRRHRFLPRHSDKTERILQIMSGHSTMRVPPRSATPTAKGPKEAREERGVVPQESMF
ncbi:hypothetical protein SKAU_G00360510 [Synaphobranchus kaupii]|uniref:ADP-ribosylation factor-like protein 15 n=1 Tax=Synaphobranchus kaupii TaxID=118154 RepID=A0A9Q1EI89_SYNKA|nr:hypothetical protein SKAU_G00360510 [Synaphobranchus kaupii]